MNYNIYNDYLFKKLRPKSDILEGILESAEQRFVKTHHIPSLYNVSVPSQDDVWICGRILNSEASGGAVGRLNEHNVVLQGSYLCSNSQTIQLNLANCPDYSIFPGQIVLAKGKNPDGKRFFCNEIIEPSFLPQKEYEDIKTIKEELNSLNNVFADSNISIKLENNEDLNVIVSAGPYMTNGSILTTNLKNLINIVKTKNAHLLILIGPFVDTNNDLIATGNINLSFEELFQKILNELVDELSNSNVQVLIQPSLNDASLLEPIYPINCFNVSEKFLKQNPFIHFTTEPSMVKVNNTKFSITSTDIIKDLTMSTLSKTTSTDKISRNFVHLLKQRSFYPIYPPPDHMPIDYEALNKIAKITSSPQVFIAVSDLSPFVKDVSNCVCMNPGKLVKGTSTGSYAQINIRSDSKMISNQDPEANKKPISANIHKLS